MALDLGQVLDGKYRIIRSIGEGGMGEVYEGENIRIRRRVAIKVLHPGFTSNADVTQRFEREAQAAGCIGNDHILEVLDLGVLDDRSLYMVMEFLDGEPLSKRIERRGRLPPREIAPIVRQLLDGLSAAHNAGIIHRDLKPDNVFVLKQKAGHVDFVKIIDFGISKFKPLSGDGMKMTRTGAVMGTPYYMSPEQANGGADADARSDVYAVGVILYEAVTGRVPFDAPTFNQLLFQIVLTEPAPPSALEPGLDRAFESIILKAMARELGSRFQSATELLHALQAWERTGEGVTVPPPAQMENLVAAAGGAVPARTAATGPRGNSVPQASGSGENWSASPWVDPAISPPAVNALAPAQLGPGSYPGHTPLGVGSQPNIAPRATGGSWATSQPGTLASGGVTTVASKKSSAPLIAAAILGFAVLAGGAGLVLRLWGGNNAAPASAEPMTVTPPEPIPIKNPAGPVVAPIDTSPATASNIATPAGTPPPAGSASAAPSRRAPQRGGSVARPSREDPKPAKAPDLPKPPDPAPVKPPDPAKPRETQGQGEGDFGY